VKRSVITELTTVVSGRASAAIALSDEKR